MTACPTDRSLSDFLLSADEMPPAVKGLFEKKSFGISKLSAEKTGTKPMHCFWLCIGFFVPVRAFSRLFAPAMLPRDCRAEAENPTGAECGFGEKRRFLSQKRAAFAPELWFFGKCAESGVKTLLNIT